jgi:hypothetical protein
MKLVNYALQTQMENLSELKSQTFFKDYIQDILEDDKKPYYQKCDYVGLSLQEVKNKIDYLSSSIRDLQALKKQLTESLDIARTLTAEVFTNNGVDRIEGNIVSSLTLSKATSKVKETITINDPNAVMGFGYVKFEPDIEAIEKALATKEGLKELSEFISINSITVTTPPKVKVNSKKASNNTTIVQTDEILTIEHKEAA